MWHARVCMKLHRETLCCFADQNKIVSTYLYVISFDHHQSNMGYPTETHIKTQF